MMVRTYGRRNRGIPSNYSPDAVAVDDDSFSQENDANHHLCGGAAPFSSSQESSSLWPSFDFDPFDLDSSQDPLPPPPGKKPRVSATKKGFPPPPPPPPPPRSSAPSTSTLMEAQEFGEMMEHVDEVNFALDGLRKKQPVRIRRASLLSLLAICATPQQRRLLRTQGMAKTIVDTILGLSADDSPSNLAAAALVYVLTCDGQDDYLLESPSCIGFLISLLRPISKTATEEKIPKIGRKLLALRTGGDSILNSSKTTDSSSAAILSKVHEVLVSCKEIKASHGKSGIERPELCPKWIALLTIEKACLSTILIEEASGTVRKSGGNFKEKLRELGGLDAVFEVAMNCHLDMKSWMEGSFPFTQNSKVDVDLRCLSLLLKCLKIMENATFLSKDNQDNLLEMKRKLKSSSVPLSFTKLVTSVIKILSDLSLLEASAAASASKKSSTQSGDALQLNVISDSQGDVDGNLFDDSSKSNLEKIYSQNDLIIWKDDQFVSTSQFENPSSETTSTSMSESFSLKTRLKSSASSSCSEISRTLSGSTRAVKNLLRKNDIVQKNDTFDLSEESQDPFAFDEDDMGPSKWEMLSGKQIVSKVGIKRNNGVTSRELDDAFQSQTLMSQEETSKGENGHSHETRNGEIDHLQETSNGENDHAHEETSNLLADCLLTAVKALMNVTNDNPVGCQQIAACGGLEIMSSLIACHFPSFSSSNATKNNNDPNDRPLSDNELDFLVAILGLLVNLVEKDSGNRSRLASASVQLPNSEALDDMSSKDVIPLLCSIFLANHGAGEAVEDSKALPCEEEDAVLQGEKEAEKMILEAYAALLLAFLSTESKSIREDITDCLPDHNLGILVPVLERFVAFHLSLNMISPETHEAVSEVIKSCRT